MNYTPLEIENFNQKDKRISFLSIFSSITQNKEVDATKIDEVVDEAIRITEKLYEKYPIIETLENNSEKPM